ncbi:sialidase family protein [Nocardia sp. NPDC005366]|uniref:sialidase family protein n=1 Tax=Nocardia sp. NPDC005366 TaxID=3156878 RepID=UPI0033BEAD61
MSLDPESSRSPSLSAFGAPWRSRLNLIAVGRRLVVAAALMGGVLVAPTQAVAEAPVSSGPGCVEAQQATFAGGASARWQACNSPTGTIGIEGGNAVNSRGTIFMGMSVKDSEGRAGLMRSRDGGESWQRVALPLPFQDLIGSMQVDTATDRLFFTSTALATSQITNQIGYSDDEGETWRVTQVGGHPFEGDPFITFGDVHQIFVGAPPAGVQTSGYPNVVYYCALTPIPSFGPFTKCWRSLDGGNSFQPTSPGATIGVSDCDFAAKLPGTPNSDTQIGPDGTVTTQVPIVHPMRGVVASDGTVYLPINACGHYVVGSSKDGGATFTWSKVPDARIDLNVAAITDEMANYPGCRETLAFAGCPEMFKGYGYDNLAMDDNGTLYFIHNNPQLLVSVSKDGGVTWTQPEPLSAPGVSRAVFSSIVARGDGELGLAYLGNSEGSNAWHGYMAVVKNADDPSRRTIATALVGNPDNPLNPYRCCGSAAGQNLDGSSTFYNLIEYNAVSYAPDGSLWASFFRDTTRDPNNLTSALYEITAGHMFPAAG